MKRTEFIGAAAAAAMVASQGPRLAAAQVLEIASARTGRKALVLSGGGNRGAYEAGAIAAIADAQGLRDGQPLDYDMVCGTSIGALNSYLIATAQYSKLHQAWSVIPSLHVTRFKKPYDKIKDPSSGVLSRLGAAVGLGLGLTREEKGVLDPAGVNSVLNEIVSPSDQVYIPLYVATTNLTRMRGEIFVRSGTTPEGRKKQAVNDAILKGYNLSVLRPATDALVRNMLFASAAIPVAFEPVLLPSLDHPGVNDSFVDGGVTENVPVDVARRCSDHLDVMLVDPPDSHPDVVVDNGAEVATAVFQTMQRRMLEYQVNLALVEGYAMANVGKSTVNNRVALSVRYIRPDRENPGRFADFDDAKAIEEMYARGYDDTKKKGWTTFPIPKPE